MVLQLSRLQLICRLVDSPPLVHAKAFTNGVESFNWLERAHLPPRWPTPPWQCMARQRAGTRHCLRDLSVLTFHPVDPRRRHAKPWANGVQPNRDLSMVTFHPAGPRRRQAKPWANGVELNHDLSVLTFAPVGAQRRRAPKPWANGVAPAPARAADAAAAARRWGTRSARRPARCAG